MSVTSSGMGAREDLLRRDTGAAAVLSGTERSAGSLGGHPTPVPAGLLPGNGFGTQDVRGVQMVPTATPAHLDLVHGELRLHRVHPGQFGLRLRLAGRRTEMVAVHVVHPGEALLAAYRAGDIGRLAVVLGRPGEVRTGVADLEQTRAARVHVGEDGSPLQRGVHDGSTSGHGGQCTHRRALPTSSRAERPGSGALLASPRATVTARPDVSYRYIDMRRPREAECSSSPSWVCSTSPRCTATNCASNSRRCSVGCAASPTGPCTRPSSGCMRPGSSRPTSPI